MNLIFRAMSVALLSVFLLTGCGETFRPIATPVATGGGDPQSVKHAVVLSSTGPAGDGATTHVNISGDTNIGQVPAGQDPVHFGFISGGNLVYVANRASSSGKPSITVYSTFTQPSLATLPSVATMPDNSAPVFVYSNVITVVYVALSGINTVGVLVPGQNILVGQIPVGTTPVAMVGLSGGSKLYVANQGSGDVTVIKQSDGSVSTTVPVGSQPSWLVASADDKFVFVLNRGSNTVSVINTATDTVSNTIPVGATPSFAQFDPRQLRVYVANSGGNTISSINADSLSPNFLAVTNITVGNNPKSLTALADGSRVYVANSGSNSVSVIGALSSAVQTTISTGSLSPVSLASSPDSSKVVVGAQDPVAVSSTHADGSAILSIRTSDNAIAATIAAPFVSNTCTNPAPASQCARMKPVFVNVTP